jgi:GNAT superfamily N-acetyltransferase
MIKPAQIAQIEAVERDAWLDIYAAAPPPIRSALGIVQRRVDDGALLICRAIDHLQFNRLGHLGVTAPARAEAVDPALADFDAAGVKNWIRGAGCRFAQHPLRRARINAASAHVGEIYPRQSCRAGRRHRARDPRGRRRRRPRVRRRRAQGFGMPPVVGDWLAALAGRPRWRCFVGFDGDTPAAAGAVFSDSACAWLGIGATVGSHRKRGAQSALLAARIDAAIASGCTLLTTETGIPHGGEPSPSYANIERAGFTIAYPRPNLRRA